MLCQLTTDNWQFCNWINLLNLGCNQSLTLPISLPLLYRTIQWLSEIIISVYITLYPGPRFNIKMTFYQCRKSHCGDKTIWWPSYLHNGISFTGKMISLYWIRALMYITATGSPLPVHMCTSLLPCGSQSAIVLNLLGSWIGWLQQSIS